MNKDELRIKRLVPLIAWITPSVKVVQVPGFWSDGMQYCHFIPCGKRGLVIFTNSDDAIGCVPLQGYTLIRPTALSLHWPIDKVITFREISKIAALEWRAKEHRRWKSISKRQGKSRSLPWWA